MNKILKYMFNNKELVVKFNTEYKTVKIGNEIFMPSIEDLKYFINKLSDVVEELEEGNEIQRTL